MKPIIHFTTTILFSGMFLSVFAQKTIKPVPEAKLKQVMELKMPLKATDANCGTRGASVAWHPLQKKYYAVFAGNEVYPFAVFGPAGNRLSPDTLKAMNDVRGLWYNPVSKRIEGNGYNEYGWFYYLPDAKGIIKEHGSIVSGLNQPNEQSTGTYDSKLKRMVFLEGNTVYYYNPDGSLSDQRLNLNLGKANGEGELVEFEDGYDDTIAAYNTNLLIYTGLLTSEYGVLNIDKKCVELYDAKTGYMTKKLSFPINATVESNFNFAYANGTYWLFDIANRAWIGYK